jgi:hypothetical protein
MKTMTANRVVKSMNISATSASTAPSDKKSMPTKALIVKINTACQQVSASPTRKMEYWPSEMIDVFMME